MNSKSSNLIVDMGVIIISMYDSILRIIYNSDISEEESISILNTIDNVLQGSVVIPNRIVDNNAEFMHFKGVIARNKADSTHDG